MAYSTELYHHGTKGMRWGIRRYQNKDGTLTDKGKQRLRGDLYDLRDNQNKNLQQRTDYASRPDLPHKWVKEDLNTSKKAVDQTRNAVKSLSKLETTTRNIKLKKEPKIDLSEMSNSELQSQINRTLLEQRYREVVTKPNISKGREHLSDALETIGPVLEVTGSALAVASAWKELQNG